MKSLVGERRAVVAAILAFYALLFTLSALSPEAPPGVPLMFLALGMLYGLGFFGLVAGWFWGRWYASGLGLWGLITSILLLWQMGALVTPIVVFLLTSAALPLFLAGEAMAAGYDGRADWRTRFHLDDPAVNRLGKSVTRAAMSLPWLLLWALAPKQSAGAEVMIPVALAGVGLYGLFRLRTWSLFALAGAAGAVAVETSRAPSPAPMALAAAVLLAAAVAPFAGPIARNLRPSR